MAGSNAHGELKCRADKFYELNVILIKSFDIEPSDALIFLKYCYSYFNSNKYPTLVITSQNWEGSNLVSYIFTQYLQTKFDFKYKFAMKQTDLNIELFESNKEAFLNAKTCSAFENWEDFIETKPDEYGDILHKRTKLFSTIPKNYFAELEYQRERFDNSGIKQKPTELLILTDTVSYGAGSNFIKNLQRYGGAIVAS